MPTVRRFEDLIAWQRSMDVAVAVHAITLRGKLARDFAMVNQLNRSAASIAANIAEGFDRGSRAEFHHFLSISKGSCAELRSHLELCRRVGYLDENTAANLVDQTRELSRIIGGLRSRVAQQRKDPR